MKLTKTKLKQLIKEELAHTLTEEAEVDVEGAAAAIWKNIQNDPVTKKIMKTLDTMVKGAPGGAALGVGLHAGVYGPAATRQAIALLLRNAAIAGAGWFGTAAGAMLLPVLNTYVGAKYIFPAVADWFLEKHGDARASRGMGGAGWEAARKDPGTIKHVPIDESKLKQIIKEELRKTLNELAPVAAAAGGRELTSPDDAELAKFAEISGRTDHRLAALERAVHELRIKVKAFEGQPAKKTNALYEPWE